MIPLPPHDPHLAGLTAAFDGDAMAEILDESLPDCVEGRVAVASCRPHYVRYKPGVSCIVQYALTLRVQDGGTSALPAYVQLYADDRAERRSRRKKLLALVASAADLHPAPPRARAAYLPQLRALVCLYPVDYSLPTLTRAASARAMREALQLALPAGAGSLTDATPMLVRYKPARKAMLRLPLAGGALDAVYAKLQTDDRGASLFEIGRSLLAAGVATAAPLAYLPEDRLIAHAAAPGVPLSSLEDGNALGRWMEPTAAALAGLHGATIAGLPEHRLCDEAAAIRDVTHVIGTLLPQLAPRLERLSETIASGFDSVPAVTVPVHGDFCNDQVIVSESGVVLIDFDEVRGGHPLLDVGMFLAHLSVAAPRGGSTLVDERAAFLDAYAQLRPASDREAALFKSAALLRRAVGPFRRLELDWPVAVERLVELTERRLAQFEAGATVPAAGTPCVADGIASDPALPQLAQLTNTAALTAEIRRALGGPPATVHAIAVVRHKPGRRCLLRFDLGDGVRLYGKTFASQRGSRVFAVTRAIVEARAFGPDVRLPEPVVYLPHLKLLLQREAPGESISPRLLAGDAALAARMGEAVHALHQSGLDLGRKHGPDDELNPLQARVEQIGKRAPALAAAARCLALVESHRRRMGEWRWRPCHRDCYHDQFLTGRAGLAILDLDDAAMSEPAVDIANVLAHLRLLGLQERDDAAALSVVAAAFSDTAFRLDPELEPDLVRFLEGASLLRLAAIHLPRSRGEWVADRLLDEAEALLAIRREPPRLGTRRPAWPRGRPCAATGRAGARRARSCR